MNRFKTGAAAALEVARAMESLNTERAATFPRNEPGNDGGWSFRQILATQLIAGTVFPVNDSGLALHCLNNTTPGLDFNISFDSNTDSVPCRPGYGFIGNFTSFNITPTAGSQIPPGSVINFIIQKIPEPTKKFIQPQTLSSSILGLNAGIGPGGTAVQTINSAAGNIPTSNLDGVSLAGVTGFRIYLYANVGQTLSGGGTINFWYFDQAAALWVPSAEADILSLSATRGYATPDWQVAVPYGRFYAEARSVTASGGANLLVKVITWGG